MPITRAAHAPRPGDLRRRRRLADGLTGPARPARPTRWRMRWTGAGRRQRHRGGQPGDARAPRSVDAFIARHARLVAPMQNMAVADRRRPHRRGLAGPRAAAPARQRPAGPGAGAGLGRALRLGRLAARRRRRRARPTRRAAGSPPPTSASRAPDYPHFITSEWALPFRQQRIEQLLAGAAHAHAGRPAAHAGRREVAGRAAAAAAGCCRRESAHPLAAAAQRAAAGFDGTMAADRAAPLIFWAWQRHLPQQRAGRRARRSRCATGSLGQRGYFGRAGRRAGARRRLVVRRQGHAGGRRPAPSRVDARA